MRQIVAASLLVAFASRAVAAPPDPGVPVIAEDWAETSAKPTPPAPRQIREAVRDELAGSKTEPVPDRYGTVPPPEKYKAFATQFEAAKVPGCLNSDGLKNQSTSIFVGLFALPFLAAAAIKGKCN